MKQLLIIFILLTIGCVTSEEFNNIKYEVVAENEKYITIMVDEEATASPQAYLDYIVQAEKQYSIELVTMITAYAFIFKKVGKE